MRARAVACAGALLIAAAATASAHAGCDWPAVDNAASFTLAGRPVDAPDAPDARIVERSPDPRRPDRYAEAIGEAWLTVHRPAQPDGSALLVLPGGGYRRVVLDKEGTALAPRFNAAGITLFVLHYRLPDIAHPDAADAPLVDARTAMRQLRACAADWSLDAARIGVMGFSAGGHLAAQLATRRDARLPTPGGLRDGHDARPDFVVLGYPVISMDPAIAHAGSAARLRAADASADPATWSLDALVDARTPPTFLLHAQDDTAVPVAHSLRFHRALVAAGVPASLHVFPHGGHGFGIRDAHGPLAGWPDLAIAWMRALPADAAPGRPLDE